MTKKKLRIGAVPTRNLPKKNEEKVSRRVIEKKNNNPLLRTDFGSLDEILLDAMMFKPPPDWNFLVKSDELIFSKLEDGMKIDQFTVRVNTGLNFSISYFGWKIPDDHIIYKDSMRSIRNIAMNRIMEILSASGKCQGVVHKDYTGELICHGVPVENVSDLDEETLVPFKSNNVFRTKDCEIFGSFSWKCSSCEQFDKSKAYRHTKKQSKQLEPAVRN